MTTKRKPRFMISLDDDSAELLTRLQKFTGLSPAQAIQKLLPSHLPELFDYLTWLEKLPKDGSAKSQLGPFLMHNYGPDTLTQAIKKLDPAHQTEGEKFAASVQAETITQPEGK
jgi:hypothetical protein